MSFELWTTVLCVPVAVVAASTKRIWKKRGSTTSAGTVTASAVLFQVLWAQGAILTGLCLLSLPALLAVSGDVGRVSVAGVAAYFTPLVTPLGGIAAWVVAERTRPSGRPILALISAYAGALAGLGLCLVLYQTVGVVHHKPAPSAHSMKEDILVRIEREREDRKLRVRGAMAWPFLWVISGTCGGVVGYWLESARRQKSDGERERPICSARALPCESLCCSFRKTSDVVCGCCGCLRAVDPCRRSFRNLRRFLLPL
jgi:hypothetical protein